MGNFWRERRRRRYSLIYKETYSSYNGISLANLCEDKWTSAGQKNSYAYQKLIELLELEIISPKTTYVWGCDYRVPMHFGLLDENYIKEIKMSATYKDDTFARELTIPIALVKLFKLLGNAKNQMCYSVVWKFKREC